MALPQFELYDPSGKHLGTYESRADAEHAIERDVQAKAAGYVIDDSAWRKQEALEFAAARVAAREAELAAEKREQAVAARVRADAEAAFKRDKQLLAESEAA